MKCLPLSSGICSSSSKQQQQHSCSSVRQGNKQWEANQSKVKQRITETGLWQPRGRDRWLQTRAGPGDPEARAPLRCDAARPAETSARPRSPPESLRCRGCCLSPLPRPLLQHQPGQRPGPRAAAPAGARM